MDKIKGGAIMGNNRLKKVNFVLAFLLMIGSFVASYHQKALRNDLIMENTLAESNMVMEDIPFMATAEISDEAAEKVTLKISVSNL